MNRPHGRCRLFHWVSYLPLPSNTCTRWFSRSATYTQPSASQVILCAMLNSPGSVPGPPQERSSLPFGAHLCTRELPYPPATSLSPSRDTPASAPPRPPPPPLHPPRPPAPPPPPPPLPSPRPPPPPLP